jgi:hypothetical protein
MSISPLADTVMLHRRDDGELEGSFGPVVVTDARGSLAGWVLTAAIGGSSGLKEAIKVVPGPAIALTGRPGEATAATPTTVNIDQPASLMSAPAGGGGGIFEISGTVTLSARSFDEWATTGLDDRSIVPVSFAIR